MIGCSFAKYYGDTVMINFSAIHAALLLQIFLRYYLRDVRCFINICESYRLVATTFDA